MEPRVEQIVSTQLDPFKNIPNEVIKNICNKLRLKSALNFGLTCKTIQKDVEEFYLFKVKLDDWNWMENADVFSLEKTLNHRIGKCELIHLARVLTSPIFKYPKYLKNLKIHLNHEISFKNFNNIMQEVGNSLKTVGFVLSSGLNGLDYKKVPFGDECDLKNIKVFKFTGRIFIADSSLYKSTKDFLKNHIFFKILKAFESSGGNLTGIKVTLESDFKAEWLSQGISKKLFSLISKHGETLKVLKIHWNHEREERRGFLKGEWDDDFEEEMMNFDPCVLSGMSNMKEIDVGFFGNNLNNEKVPRIFQVVERILEKQENLEILKVYGGYFGIRKVICKNSSSLKCISIKYGLNLSLGLDFALFREINNCCNLQRLSLDGGDSSGKYPSIYTKFANLHLIPERITYLSICFTPLINPKELRDLFERNCYKCLKVLSLETSERFEKIYTDRKEMGWEFFERVLGLENILIFYMGNMQYQGSRSMWDGFVEKSRERLGFEYKMDRELDQGIDILWKRNSVQSPWENGLVGGSGDSGESRGQFDKLVKEIIG